MTRPRRTAGVPNAISHNDWPRWPKMVLMAKGTEKKIWRQDCLTQTKGGRTMMRFIGYYNNLYRQEYICKLQFSLDRDSITTEWCGEENAATICLTFLSSSGAFRLATTEFLQRCEASCRYRIIFEIYCFVSRLNGRHEGAPATRLVPTDSRSQKASNPLTTFNGNKMDDSFDNGHRQSRYRHDQHH